MAQMLRIGADHLSALIRPIRARPRPISSLVRERVANQIGDDV
jgi:hypothetical protein